MFYFLFIKALNEVVEITFNQWISANSTNPCNICESLQFFGIPTNVLAEIIKLEECSPVLIFNVKFYTLNIKNQIQRHFLVCLLR